MSSKSESHDPLNSIFQCCVNGLTTESKNAQDPTPGLFKILTLLNKGSATFNGINGDGSPIFSPSSKSKYPKEIYVIDSNTDIASENATNATHLPDEPLEGLLNPQRIGSSIYYDSSDKGDAIAVVSRKKSFFGLQKTEKLSSVPPALQGARTFDPMSGDCLYGQNHKLGKLVVPERKIHEVYYSMTETNISTKAAKQMTISNGESSPAKSASSESNCISSDEESISKSDSEISESNSTVDTNQETLPMDKYMAKDEYAIYANNINSKEETNNEDDYIDIEKIKNNNSVLNEPPLLSTSTPINDSEIQPSPDDVSLYVRQFVGNLSPSSLGSNFSYHDFSHLF